MRSRTLRLTGGDPWAAYSPSAAAPWDLRRVVHLHRRAGFAASWDVLQRDLKDGHIASLDRVLVGDPQPPHVPDRFEETALDLAESAESERQPARLKAWWMYRMAFGPDPLGERLALMWHNHFATSNLKLEDLSAMRRQNEHFRRHGRGKFGDLLKKVVREPAILLWLDAPENRKGRPNENLARELMELFTLGVGHYTETDVKEAARALTGWSVVEDEFRFVGADHDTGTKTILGKSGPMTGDDLLSLLLEQRDTADRVAWRICDTFLGENVAAASDREALAAGLWKHDLDVGWAVATVLRSELFFREENMRSRVVGPAELVAGAVRAMGFRRDDVNLQLLAAWTTAMGQDLFYPPNVGGWAGGRSWLAAREAIARANFARTLAAGELVTPAAPPDILGMSRRYGRTELASFLAELLLGTPPPASWSSRAAPATQTRNESAQRTLARALSSPEFQLG